MDRVRLHRFAVPSPVAWLLAGQGVMFIGIAGIFPVAPLYVRAHGGGTIDVALFVAGPLIANTLVQVPAGRMTDRVGRRPVLVGSRLVYAALALVLFADAGPLWLLASVRTLQGASSGAYVPALRAALGDLSGPEERGRRFAQLQAVEMGALLVGPLLGGALALWRTSAIFGLAGVLVLLGLVAMRRVPESRGSEPPAARQRLRWWATRGLLVPALGVAALGTVLSMYDVIWPLYLAARGYDTLAIGLSISLFALPILVLAAPGGRLADRANRRVLMMLSFGGAGACAAIYPWLRSLPAILAVGAVEACAVLLVEPTLFAVIGDSTTAAQRGRAMGLGGLFQFGGSALGALVLGSVYALGELPAFAGAAACLFAAALLCGLALPARPLDGRPRAVPEVGLPFD